MKNSMVVPNVYIIAAGPIPSNPVELMTHSRVESLIDGLKSEFDYILLDTAPVGLVADAYSLAPYADAAVFLVRYNYTSKNQIALINDVQANKKFNQPMIVLNDAKKENGYTHKYGYSEPKKVKSLKRIARV
jgi:Mrp family chromosome partitioning ATPase